MCFSKISEEVITHISPLFRYNELNAQGRKKAQRVAELFNALLEELKPLMPAGREAALVSTKLEEACFFAKKAISTDESNQVFHHPFPVKLDHLPEGSH